MSSFCPGLGLCPEVQDLLEACELPELPSSLLLPEDMALRNLPPLRAAHTRFSFDTDRPLLSVLEEVRSLLVVPGAEWHAGLEWGGVERAAAPPMPTAAACPSSPGRMRSSTPLSNGPFPLFSLL